MSMPSTSVFLRACANTRPGNPAAIAPPPAPSNCTSRRRSIQPSFSVMYSFLPDGVIVLASLLADLRAIRQRALLDCRTLEQQRPARCRLGGAFARVDPANKQFA